MTDMKCPVCNKQMKIGTLDQDDSMGTVWMSIMPCNCVCSYGASKAVWQELIRTKKQLEIAVDALRRAQNSYCAEEEDIVIDLTESAAHKWQRTAYQMEMPISIALEQITALEQKDVK